MRLIKDNDVFCTDDKTVIRAFKLNGYAEAPEEKKEAPAVPKKKPIKKA